MKVVLRSSSLLFTLLSIVLHVPIRRAKRSESDAPLPGPQQPPSTYSDGRAVSTVKSGGQGDLF